MEKKTITNEMTKIEIEEILMDFHILFTINENKNEVYKLAKLWKILKEINAI